MGLVKCKDCGTEISNVAPACPTCGRPGLKAKAGGTSAGGVFGGLFLFFIVLPAFLLIGSCAVILGNAP